MALLIGGLQMARAVRDPELSEEILRACRMAAGELAGAAAGGAPPEGDTEPNVRPVG
jgi:hypothetical protein